MYKIFGLILVILVILSCDSSQRELPIWGEYTAKFVYVYYRERPSLAVSNGRHEFDGLLTDFSSQGANRRIGRLRAAKRAALDYDIDKLAEKQLYERNYLLAFIDRELFNLEVAKWPQRKPSYYIDHLDPRIYLSDYSSMENRVKKYIRFAEAIPNALNHIQDTLLFPMPKHYFNNGKRDIDRLAHYYQYDVTQAFQSHSDHALKSKFIETHNKAYAAILQFSQWLSTKEKYTTDNYVEYFSNNTSLSTSQTSNNSLSLEVRELVSYANERLQQLN